MTAGNPSVSSNRHCSRRQRSETKGEKRQDNEMTTENANGSGGTICLSNEEAATAREKVSKRRQRSSRDGVTDTIPEWRRVGREWRLFLGRRCFGRVVPDPAHPSMWRSIMPNRRLSGMANLPWAKAAVLASAEREIEYAARSANRHAFTEENEGVFAQGPSPVRSNGLEACT
jgi:hypothetical protein